MNNIMKLVREFGLLVLALVALLVVSGLGTWGLYTLKEQAEVLYNKGFVAIEQVAAVEVELQEVHSLVRGVPAEMDLGKVAAGKQAFAERVSALREKLGGFEQRNLADGTPADDVLAAYGQEGDKVFGFAQSFAQDQANNQLAKEVRPRFELLNGLIADIKRAAVQAAQDSRKEMAAMALLGTWMLLGIAGALVVVVGGLGGYLGYMQQQATRETHRVIGNVTDMLGKVTETTQGMRGDASEMNEAAVLAGKNTADTAAAVEQTTGNMTSVSAAVEELASTTESIAGLTRDAAGITEQAVGDIRKAGDAVAEMNVSVEQIGRFVETITAIAEQTNLLALNAAIEAARAGDAGRGFAVVADEVRKLANESNSAAGDIVAQITSIQQVAGTVAQLIEATTESVARMGEITHSVNQSVQEQQHATGDISRSVNEVSGSMQQVAQDVESLSRVAEEVSKKSGRLQESSGALAEASGTLRENVDAFIKRIA
ncbi:MAG: MCP four helix bundle domain-containing protein [Pseudomonadaceae bacterium]|nr:MCP four helix bundle domain-containing protein [Pseudomonadaceae bacterium]